MLAVVAQVAPERIRPQSEQAYRYLSRQIIITSYERILKYDLIARAPFGPRAHLGPGPI